LLEAAAFLGLVTIWSLAVTAYINLPEIIPTHFGINGKADDWGNKVTVFILPAISMVLFIGISILNRFPHIFNYPVRVTAENANFLYSRGTRLIRIIKVSILIIMLFIEFQIYLPKGTEKVPGWFIFSILSIPVLLPIVLALTLTGYFRTKNIDKKPSQNYK
jgi:uncharacterized membrane protein